MSINITMPALSPTMEEGKLAKWHVKEGDSVSSGDVIAEIETDKATMEVESIDEGIVGKIVVPEGTEGVKVNAVIAVILTEGENAADIKTDAPAPAAKAPEPAKAEAPKADPSNGEAGAITRENPATQSASQMPSATTGSA
ncbi:MAG: biotin/lipoyl-binding protein, partial [Verrucomicrobiaceae bacterium]